MPIYEYLCESCGERLEQLQKIDDPPLRECPACGERSLRRLLSAPAFQFKGSGWYVTDYARKEKGGAAKSGEGGTSEPAAKEPGSGDGAAKGGSPAPKAAKTDSSD